MLHISFYKFVSLTNLKTLRENLLTYCREHNIKGKILIAEEGINGMIAGEKNKIENFKNYITNFEEFSDLFFKQHQSLKQGYKKMFVKIKSEIITFNKPISLERRGKHLNPQKLQEMYENNEDFAIIDMRNDFEYDIGHFKNAIKLNTQQFSQLPEEIERIKEKIKNKPIVTYCTGGIRCEKGTAYLKELGFEDVYQLDGGIINYGEKIGDNYWEGKCFVFDTRGAVEIDPQKQQDNYSQCRICFVPEDKCHRCPECGEEFIMCDECTKLIENCCSKFCRNKQREKYSKSVNTLTI